LIIAHSTSSVVGNDGRALVTLITAEFLAIAVTSERQFLQ
jgi:hypothetical protein